MTYSKLRLENEAMPQKKAAQKNGIEWNKKLFVPV